MKIAASFVLLVPLAAQAQLALFAWDGRVETPVGSVVDLGRVAAGSVKEAVFRARNPGPGGVTITTLSANGAGFSTPDRPSLPHSIPPGNFLQFTVRFAAGGAQSYSANLQVNGISAIVLAASVPAAAFSVLAGCGAGEAVDFGRVQLGSTASCTFALSNPNAQTLTIASITVTGAGFSGPQGVSVPLQLRPGDVATFTVSFSPTTSEVLEGMLTADSKVTRLVGSGFDPPLPRPTLAFDSPAIVSAQQRSISMTLAAPAPAAASGVLTLTFTPASSGVADDAAILFVATGSRRVSFAVNRGETVATLGGKSSAIFQTGTTAGTIRFTVDAGSVGIAGDPTTSVSIAGVPVAIESALAGRRATDLDVTLIGFDNTYSAGVMTFTFFDTAGRAIEPGAIRADFTADFRTFFSSAPAGSAFVARVTFPVTGDASQVAGVEVELSNAAGSARTQRVLFK